MYADAPTDTFHTQVYPWAPSEEVSGNKAMKGMIATYKNWVVEFTEHQALHSRNLGGEQECISYPNKEERTKGVTLSSKYVVLFHNYSSKACIPIKFFFIWSNAEWEIPKKRCDTRMLAGFWSRPLFYHVCQRWLVVHVLMRPLGQILLHITPSPTPPMLHLMVDNKECHLWRW